MSKFKTENLEEAPSSPITAEMSAPVLTKRPADQMHDGDKEPPPATGCYPSSRRCLGCIIGCLGCLPFCFCCPNPYKRIQQGYTGLISEFGQFQRVAPPGLVYLNPVTQSLQNVDVRVRVQPLPRQQIFTHDNVSVEVDSVIYWKISDPVTASYHVGNVTSALIERAQTTMREICSIRELQDMLTHRDQMAEEIKRIIEATAFSWGVEIESILIKDIIMNSELQDNLSAAAVARRQGASLVITAQAEVEAAKLMREASDIMATPAAMQFRYLETLQKMAQHAQTRVIFVPTSLTDVNKFTTGAAMLG